MSSKTSKQKSRMINVALQSSMRSFDFESLYSSSPKKMTEILVQSVDSPLRIGIPTLALDKVVHSSPLEVECSVNSSPEPTKIPKPEKLTFLQKQAVGMLAKRLTKYLVLKEAFENIVWTGFEENTEWKTNTQMHTPEMEFTPDGESLQSSPN